MNPIDLLFWLFACFAFLLGAVVGSFLNVVIYRVPAGLSIVHPPSRCPSCEARIRWYDNIPIISWIFLLGGKCRDCGVDIPAQYTIVEALTGFLTLLLWFKIAHAPFSSMAAFEQAAPLTYILPFALYFIFICLLIVITFVDLEHLLIPHVFTLPGIALGLAAPVIFNFALPPGGLAGFWPPVTIFESVIGAVAGAVTVIAIFYGYFAIRGIPGIGGGDVTLMALVGAWLGWPALIFIFFAASFQGVIAAGLAVVFGGGLLRDGAEIFAEDDESAVESGKTAQKDAQIDESLVDPDKVGEESAEVAMKAEDSGEISELSAQIAASRAEDAENIVDQESLGADESDISVEISDESVQSDADRAENDDSGPLAVPFGPFIALATLEHFFLGDLLPAGISMSYLYEFGTW